MLKINFPNLQGDLPQNFEREDFVLWDKLIHLKLK